MRRSVSVDHVHQVVAIEDRVLRNYWVTQTYADLSTHLAALLDPDTANWCTFATWASYTVGRNLRGDDLPAWLQRRVMGPDGVMGVAPDANTSLDRAWSDSADPAVRAEPRGDLLTERFGACATDLSKGNTEVFAEIAPVAATFVEAFSGAEADHADHATARATVLDACKGAPVFEGHNRLQAGFAHWCAAMAETDPIRRSQLILAGSLELGAHEQNHLQERIAGAMTMGMNESLARVVRTITLASPVEVRTVEVTLARLFRPAGGVVADAWGGVMTELLGTIVLPDGTLHLDHDVPPLPGEPFFPADLDPVVLPELATLLARFNRATPEGRRSRAEDWVSLDNRMNFIANLFCSRHHCSRLFDPPFGPDLLADIEQDRPPPNPVRARADRRPVPRAEGQRGVIPPSRGTAMFTDSFVAELFDVGDPPADDAVAAYLDATVAEPTEQTEQTDHVAHADLFRRLATSSPSAVADEDLPGVGTFMCHDEPWPDWADPDLVRDGQQVFGDYGLQLGMGLFMASLPSDYAFAKGVQALARTARLTRDPKRRYVETGQMIIEAMTPGALEPGRDGYRAVRHVRLMHAAVRHVLHHLAHLEQGRPFPIEPWPDDLGLPINQVQLLGTLFSFGVEGVKTLSRTGVRLSAYRKEAYIHVWNLVGHQIGVRPDLLPLSWEDSFALWESRRTTASAATPEGKELTRAAIECMQELFGFSQMPGLPATGIRYFVGDRIADLLGVPGSDWTRVVFEVMTRADSAYEFGLSHLPLTRSLAALLGRRLWRGFEDYGRAGERPAFRVTDELAAAWGLR